MTTIPDDVMEAARDVAREFAKSFVLMGPLGVIGPAARAIMAERERCAKIAEWFGAERAGAGDGQTYILRDVNGHDVAAAIRNKSASA